MMADASAGRRMEVQAIVGEVVTIAKGLKVPTPRLTTLYVLLQGLEHSLLTGSEKDDKRSA